MSKPAQLIYLAAAWILLRGGVTRGEPPTSPPPDLPPYKVLRWDEDYRYLQDPSLHADLFDPVKYIPLSASDPDSYLSVGGHLRERYEAYANPDFGLGGQGHDDYLLQRIYLHADLHLGEHVRFFVEGISAFQWGQDGPSSPSQTDVVDLHQAFVDLSLGAPHEGVRVRLGRQEMPLGSSRLVGIRDGPNVRLAQDGIRTTFTDDNASLDVFAMRVVNTQKYEFDDGDNGQALWGAYGTVTLAPELGIDLYYLGFRDDRTNFDGFDGSQTRHSVGARAFGKVSEFTYDVEGVFQFGEFEGDPIRAWTVASTFEYALSGLPLSPRLGLKADIASGGGYRTGNTVHTFDPLLFKAPYFNEAGLIRPSNLMDLHPTLAISPTRDSTLTLGYDMFWRYSSDDALYDIPGNVQVPARASGGRAIGSAAEATFEWQINRHTQWTVAYVHFFTGDFIGHAGGKDVDFLGTWLQFNF